MESTFHLEIEDLYLIENKNLFILVDWSIGMNIAHNLVEESLVLRSALIVQFLNTSGIGIKLIDEMSFLSSLFMLNLTRNSEMWNRNELLDSFVVLIEEFPYSAVGEIELRTEYRSDLLFSNPSPSALFDDYSCGESLENASQEGWAFLLGLEGVFE